MKRTISLTIRFITLTSINHKKISVIKNNLIRNQLFIMRDITVVFVVLSLFAEILGTVGGFGSSVFFVPIANMYFDFQTVLGITALFHVFSNLSKIALFNKGLDKKILLWIGLPAVVFVIGGALLSKVADLRYIEKILGVFLVIFSLFFILFPKIEIKPDKTMSVGGGALSGFLAGFLGTGGAVRGLTMAAFNLEKTAFVATSAAIDFFVDMSRAVTYYINGYINKEMWPYIIALLLVSITGTYIGKKIMSHMPQEKFRFISLSLIFLIGLLTLVGYKL